MNAPKTQLKSGFTLIELIVVLAIIALMLSIATPRYFHSIDRAKESTLRQNLSIMRETIDQFHGDIGRYPNSLDELVERKYIRSLPIDPLTESSNTWQIVAPDNSEFGAVLDIHSGSEAKASDGSFYNSW